jgi:pimeloyl-ACP methyl ester carboxylesterase
MSPDFVLCHGAFSDETAWAKVAPALRGAGAKVTLVTLPGHSDADTAEAGRFTLDDYVAAVAAALDASSAPALLVGHSMGGVAITQTAERHADSIAALVYLSAYLPENGRSLLTYSQDPESELGPGLHIDAEHGVGTIGEATMRAAFFNATAPADADAAVKRLRPEPLQPFGTPVATTAANWGALTRYYITTTRDRAVGPSLQKQMYTAQPCRHVYSIDTDHSSYFSAPDELVRILLDIRAQTAS